MEDQQAAQHFPSQLKEQLSLQLLDLDPSDADDEQHSSSADRLSRLQPSRSLSASSPSHTRSPLSPASASPSLTAAPLTRHSSSSSASDYEDEETDHAIDSSGKLRRYTKRPSITINSENALQHQDLLVSSSPITPVSPVITAVIAASPPATLLQRWTGFIMLAVSAFFFSVMSLGVSLTGGRVNSMLLVGWRCLSQLTLSVIILLAQRQQLLGEKGKRKWIFARGAVGVGSLSCFYYALTHLPLSEATVLFFTAPIWTGILGKLILHESFDRWDCLAAAASFIGVVFVARPSFLFGTNVNDVVVADGNRAFGVFIALLGAFISAFVYIFIRKVGKGSHPLVLVGYLGAIGLVAAPFDLLFETWTMPQGTDLLYMALIGTFAFGGQYLFNAGVQKEKAGVSSLVRNLDIVFSFIWQLTVEGVTINGWSFLGAFIVTGSVIGLGVRKWRRDRLQTGGVTAPVKQPVEVVVKGEAEGGNGEGETDEASMAAFHEAREVEKRVRAR